MAGNFDFHSPCQEGIGHPFDFRRHGGRIKERLAGKRGQGENTLDVGDKAHVQHAVSLVDHHDLHACQQQLAAFMVIKQPARRGNQDINAAINQFVLLAKRYAADQQRLGQLGILGINFKVFCHLRRQFAGRAQHKTARHARLCPALAQQSDHRQRKAGGFASAGLGDAQHVFALQRVRDRLFLNRCGGFIACFGHGAQHAGIKR